MPDRELKTVSASQVAGLFGASPWVTPWMLYQQYINGGAELTEEHSRMRWGRLMQPLLTQAASEDLKLEVRPNEEDIYIRRGVLGCTRDAEIICPDRGVGALETKCVFDYGSWMSDWGGGKFAPRHYELQLQCQMFVGNGEQPYQWGVIAAWVLGEMRYFERKPMPDVWSQMENSARAFLADVEAKKPPRPFGDPIELPWLVKAFPLDRGRVLDLQADPSGEDVAEMMRQYTAAKEAENKAKKTAEQMRAKLLATAEGAAEVRAPGGCFARISESKRGETTVQRLTVRVPEDNKIDPDFLMAG